MSRNTATAWLDRAITRKLRDTIVERLAQSQLLLASTEAAFRSGQGSQASVFDARVEVERSRDSLDEIDRELAVARVRLSRWIGAAAEQAPGPVPPLVWHGVAGSSRLEHAEIRLAGARIAHDQARARVAETAQKSDWTLGLSYGRRGSLFGDSISLQVSIPWQLNQEAVQTQQWLASRLQVTSSELRREEIVRSETSRIDTLAASLRHLNKRVARYKHRIIPIASQRAQAALAEYSGGSGTLSAVLHARRAQFELQAEQTKLERLAARAWAELKYLDGPPVLANQPRGETQ